MIAVFKNGEAQQVSRLSPVGFTCEKIIIDADDVSHILKLLKNPDRAKEYFMQLSMRFNENRMKYISSSNASRVIDKKTYKVIV